MAKVKIGDRVRFLNDVGEGIVRNILRSGVVYVEDESGFEVPVMENELVVVTEGATIVPKPQPNKSLKETLGTQEEAAAPKSAQPSRARSQDKEGELLNIHLCYLVEEGGTIGRDEYEAFLVNESNYDLMVLYMTGKDAKQEVRFSGIVPFDSTEFIDHFPPSELPSREKTTIQIIALKEKGEIFQPKDAMTIEVKVDGARFFRQNAFVENVFFEDPAIVMELVKDDKPLRNKRLEAEKLQEQMMAQKIKADLKREKRKKAVASNPTKEPLVVDLHIHELVDSTVGMEPKHMLDLQLSKVKGVMDQYQKPKYKGCQIVFIHGKGEGVLRKAVIELIQRQYPKSELQDASFQEFGFGATRVTIK